MLGSERSAGSRVNVRDHRLLGDRQEGVHDLGVGTASHDRREAVRAQLPPAARQRTGGPSSSRPKRRPCRRSTPRAECPRPLARWDSRDHPTRRSGGRPSSRPISSDTARTRYEWPAVYGSFTSTVAFGVSIVSSELARGVGTSPGSRPSVGEVCPLGSAGAETRCGPAMRER